LVDTAKKKVETFKKLSFRKVESVRRYSPLEIDIRSIVSYRHGDVFRPRAGIRHSFVVRASSVRAVTASRLNCRLSQGMSFSR